MAPLRAALSARYPQLNLPAPCLRPPDILAEDPKEDGIKKTRQNSPRGWKAERDVSSPLGTNSADGIFALRWDFNLWLIPTKSFHVPTSAAAFEEPGNVCLWKWWLPSPSRSCLPKPRGEENKSQNHLHLFPLTDFLTGFCLLQALSLAWALLREASCVIQGCREVTIWAIETAQCLLRVKCPAKWGRCCLVTIYNPCNNMCSQYFLISRAELESLMSGVFGFAILCLQLLFKILVYFVAWGNANTLFCLFVRIEPKCWAGYYLPTFLSPGKSFPCTHEENEWWGKH